MLAIADRLLKEYNIWKYINDRSILMIKHNFLYLYLKWNI